MEGDIGKWQEGINREIGIFLDAEIEEAVKRNLPPDYVRTIESLRQFILRGGKRLRPFLFFQAYVLSGGERKDDAVKAAIAMEFLHAGLLIQDDVMDEDSKRHGGNSVFAQYEQDYGSRFAGSNLRHFAYSMAICAGDMVLSWSFKVLAQSNFDGESRARSIARLSEILAETSLGQMLDEISQFGDDYEEERVYAVQDFKTARYSVVGPLQMGAILAGVSQAELDFIADFARPLGIAYQIQDDILGVFGDSAVTGKPVGSDLREGKKTLLVSYAVANAASEDRDFFITHLGKGDISEEDVKHMQLIIEKSGSLAYSQDKIIKLFEESRNKMRDGGAGIGSKYAPLQDFADFLLGRKK